MENEGKTLEEATNHELDKEVQKLANSAGGQGAITADTIRRRLLAKNGECALCGGDMWIGGANPLPRPSLDRINRRKGYQDPNVQIVHLGCNYGRNKYSILQCKQWLNLIP